MSIDNLIEKAKAKGAEHKYFTWLRKWPSVLSDTYGEYVEGEGRSVVAHVRRVSAGSGVAVKPPFFAVPMTQEEHDKTHQHGEEIFNPPEWFEKKAIAYLCHYVNSMEPPEESANQWRKVFDVEHPNHVNAIKLRAIKYFEANPKRPLRITVEPAYKKRSSAQNRSQWGCVYQQAYEFFQKNPKEFAELIIETVYGEYSYGLLHELFKVKCNEGKSTITSTSGSSEYINNIMELFIKRYGYEIKPPEKPESYY